MQHECNTLGDGPSLKVWACSAPGEVQEGFPRWNVVCVSVGGVGRAAGEDREAAEELCNVVQL